MKRSYGQYCPLALATELLCERWSLLIVSRVADGCRHFNDIHRGVPRISPSLLAQRLRVLERAGVIARKSTNGAKPEYVLTSAGEALTPIIDALAIWGQHWARDMVRDDMDPAFLVWSMHLRLDTDRMPKGRTVLQFDFSGAPREPRRFWLVHEDGQVEMCLKDPGFEVTVWVESDLRVFIEAWRGIRDLRKEMRAQRIKVRGPAHSRRELPHWLLGSALAPYPRRYAGEERRRFKTRTDSGAKTHELRSG
jgi:DNA-binding HxlR family transcriptional regulator